MIAIAFRLPKSRKTSEVLLGLTLAIFASLGAAPALAQGIDGAIIVEEPKVILTEAHFKQLLFGNNTGKSPQQTPESVLENELQAIDRCCTFSAEQRRSCDWPAAATSNGAWTACASCRTIRVDHWPLPSETR